MPLEVRWDEERQSDIGTHESLLQHLSLSVDDEKTKQTVKLNANVMLTPVSTSCLVNQCMIKYLMIFLARLWSGMRNCFMTLIDMMDYCSS